MVKGGNRKTKIEVEDEDEEKSVVEISSSDDDDEANEDLSVKIVEKALLMRAAKFTENDNDGVLLDNDDCSKVIKNDTGVVYVTSGIGSGDDNLAGVASPSSWDGEVVVVEEAKRKRKKKKLQKREIENQCAPTVKEEEKSEIINKAEQEEKAETIEKMVEAKENGEVAASVEMSDQIMDGDVVYIPENMVLRKLLRGSRYFDPPDSGWPSCYNCGKEGHMAVNCPSFEKKRRPCFLCGSLEHGVKQCSKERVCVICKSVGHRANKCPEKYNSGPPSSKVCLKCGDFGHDICSCQNSYTLADLKEIQCYICKNFGHLCCVNSVNSSPRAVSCYQCGELGHTGLECSRLHEEAMTSTSSSSCFKCGEEGHFVRDCTNSVKAKKKNHEPSTPTLKHRGENKEALGSKSAPQALGKSRKKRKSRSEKQNNKTPKKPKQNNTTPKKPKQNNTTPKSPKQNNLTLKKPKQRGGWLMEDQDNFSEPKSKNNYWRSPSTPYHRGHQNSNVTTGYQMMSSSPYSHRMYNSHSGMSNCPYYRQTQNIHWGTPTMQRSTSSFHNRYSASRFSNSGSDNYRGDYNWW